MWRTGLITLIAVLFVSAACGDDDAEPTATSVAATTDSSPTSVAATAATTSPPSTDAVVTDTTVPDEGFAIPEYSIEAREVGDTGDTVVILLAPGTYSDLDLENVVADVVQRFAPIATVHVVDDQDAVPLVLGQPVDLQPADNAALDEHYFARLEEGFRLVFEGPFAALPEVILGS